MENKFSREEFREELGKYESMMTKSSVDFDYLKELCEKDAGLLDILFKIKESAYNFVETIIKITKLTDTHYTYSTPESEFKEMVNSLLLEQKNQELDMEEGVREFTRVLKEKGRDIGWADKIGTTRTDYEKFALSFVFNEIKKSISAEAEVEG